MDFKRHDFPLINGFICIFQALMRELELREKKVNDIQVMGDKLVRDGHPGKKAVEVITLVNSAVEKRPQTVQKLVSEAYN